MVVTANANTIADLPAEVRVKFFFEDVVSLEVVLTCAYLTLADLPDL
jgi:hypothetical protein